MGFLRVAPTPRSNTSYDDRPCGQRNHGAQNGSSNDKGTFRSEHPVIHDRRTGPHVVSLPLDQRAFDRRRYGAEPRPVAGVVGDLLVGGSRATATEQGGAQLSHPRHGQIIKRAGTDPCARIRRRVHTLILTQFVAMPQPLRLCYWLLRTWPLRRVSARRPASVEC